MTCFFQAAVVEILRHQAWTEVLAMPTHVEQVMFDGAG